MVKRPGKTQKGILIDSSWFLACGGLDVRVPFGALFDTETSFPSGKCLYYGTGTSQTRGGTALSPQHMLRIVLDYRPWLCVSLWFTWAGQGQCHPDPLCKESCLSRHQHLGCDNWVRPPARTTPSRTASQAVPLVLHSLRILGTVCWR